MRCIFCLHERPGSKEHVFPLAIGGHLTTDRVCSQCNSTLGSRVDAALSNSYLVRMRRAELGLAGNSRTPPALHELLLGTSALADHPGQRVQTTFNAKTGKLDSRLLPYVADVVTTDGSKARQIVVDERDVDQLPKIIQRERKRHGVPPLPPEQLAAEVKRFSENVMVINNPRILMERSYSFAYVRHAILKIAYELAFLWLGEAYLDDPAAAELRAAICDPDPASTDRLAAWAGEADNCEVFRYWSVETNNHLALAFAGDDGIAIAVRVFDIHAAVVWVATDAARYLSGPDTGSKLRFLASDPVSGAMRDTSMMDEWWRVAAAMVASRET